MAFFGEFVTKSLKIRSVITKMMGELFIIKQTKAVCKCIYPNFSGFVVHIHNTSKFTLHQIKTLEDEFINNIKY